MWLWNVNSTRSMPFKKTHLVTCASSRSTFRLTPWPSTQLPHFNAHCLASKSGIWIPTRNSPQNYVNSCDWSLQGFRISGPADCHCRLEVAKPFFLERISMIHLLNMQILKKWKVTSITFTIQLWIIYNNLLSITGLYHRRTTGGELWMVCFFNSQPGPVTRVLASAWQQVELKIPGPNPWHQLDHLTFFILEIRDPGCLLPQPADISSTYYVGPQRICLLVDESSWFDFSWYVYIYLASHIY